MLKHDGETPLEGIPALEANVKFDGSHVGVAKSQLPPGVGGDVSDVMQISNSPSAIIPATLTFTWVPWAYPQVAVAVPLAPVAALQEL
jgi:hypothetical protein